MKDKIMDTDQLSVALFRVLDTVKERAASGDPEALTKLRIVMDDFLALTKRFLAVAESVSENDKDREMLQQAIQTIELGLRATLS